METLFSWVHLSDMHFGHGDASALWDQRRVVTALGQDIVRIASTSGPRPDAMLVTGDIAFSGGTRSRPGETESSEYRQSREWLCALAESLELARDRVFTVPGNHDVQRDVATADRNVARLLDALRSERDTIDNVWMYETDRELLERRMKNYLEFAAGFSSDRAQPFWVTRIPRPWGTVRIAGLNTALLAAAEDDHGKLQIGNEQLVRCLINPPGAKGEITIALSHHPFDWLRDAKSVERDVRNHAQLHLCGHVHEQESFQALLGGGGGLLRVVAGAVHDITTPGAGPVDFGYNFGSLVAESDGRVMVRVWPRHWSRRNGDFRVDVDNVPKERDYAEHDLEISLEGSHLVRSSQAATLPAGSNRTETAGSDKLNALSSPLVRVQALRRAGEALVTSGDQATAESILIRALEVALKLEDPTGRVEEVALVATALAACGATDRARQSVSQAVESVVGIADSEAKANASAALGDALSRVEQVAVVPGPVTGEPQQVPGRRDAESAGLPSVRRVRVFVASPGDVGDERQQLANVVGELNRTLAPALGLVLELVRWETDTYPAMGRPQGVINEQIGDYDIFVGILWKRLGTPTGVAESGTVEEFRRAEARWRRTGQPHIMVYFCSAPMAPPSSPELEQISGVAKFRDELLTKGLAISYSDHQEFGNLVRPHLALLLQRKFALTALTSAAAAPADLSAQVRDLAKEYELIREILPSGAARTNRMEAVVSRMRSMAGESQPHLDELEQSGSAGERLMAVSILREIPQCAHLAWLRARFSPDASGSLHAETPFVVYHAAAALREAARVLKAECGSALAEVARYAHAEIGRIAFGTNRHEMTLEVMQELDLSPPRSDPECSTRPAARVRPLSSGTRNRPASRLDLPRRREHPTQSKIYAKAAAPSSRPLAAAIAKAATALTTRSRRARPAKRRARAAAAAPAAPPPMWQSIGPSLIANGQTYGSNHVDIIGRVSSIAVDPNDPKHLLLGAAGGGIWESANTGTTWTPRTDQMPSLAIGAIAFDPTNPKRVYAGSGEGNFYANLGAGVYKSTDGGATWAVSASAPFVGVGFYDLVVDPQTPAVLYAATTSGFYKSTNSGVSWSLKRAGRCWDISVHPNGGSVEILAAFADGLFVSTNGGNTFAGVALPSWPAGSLARLAVDRVKTAPTVAYAFAAIGAAAHLWRRAGAVWTKITTPAGLNVTQAWYDWYVAAMPNIQNQVYIGAIDAFRGSISGSTGTWTNITRQSANSIHPDQHCLTFAPNNPQVIYAGNDGGIYRSTNSGATWTALNKGLGITEIEYLASDPNTSKWLMAGTQSNGTIRYTGPTVWDHIADGDGGDCGVNPFYPNEVYHSYYGISLERSSNKGNSWTGLAPPNVPSLFYPPVEVFGATVGISGASLVVSRNSGASWTTVPLGHPANDVASAMDIPDADTVLIGTTRGRVLRLLWNGTTWNKVQLASPAPRYISCIAVDPSNLQRFWVTISQIGGGLVYRSDNAGSSWVNCTAGLPSIPMNSVVVDPANFKRVWVAADVGVYQTLDLGSSWAAFSNGLPNAMAADLLFHKQDRMLICATRNRGAWVTPVP